MASSPYASGGAPVRFRFELFAQTLAVGIYACRNQEGVYQQADAQCAESREAGAADHTAGGRIAQGRGDLEQHDAEWQRGSLQPAQHRLAEIEVVDAEEPAEVPESIRLAGTLAP